MPSAKRNSSNNTPKKSAETPTKNTPKKSTTTPNKIVSNNLFNENMAANFNFLFNYARLFRQQFNSKLNISILTFQVQSRNELKVAHC